MANNGLKQATIAYKVSKPGGTPLDIYGKSVAVSGLPQAIALLTGQTNPNPVLYVVERYFEVGEVIRGNVTQEYDPISCPVFFMSLSDYTIVLSPGTPTRLVTLFSSNAWQIVAGSPNIATPTPASGATGSTVLNFTRTSTTGQRFYVFRDVLTNQTIQLYVINTLDPNAWVLATGAWNMLGFWFNTAVWHM